MSQVFSKIGGLVGGAGSAISSFLGNRQKNKYLTDQINYQKFLRSLSTNPAKMSQYVSGFQKPLDQGLVSGVNNQVQAFGAERGLSTSPQIMAEIEAQALGPLQQNQQQMAINEAMASLGIPSGTPDFGGTAPQPLDISAIIKNLLGGKSSPDPVMIGQGASQIDTSGITAGTDASVPPLEVPGGDSGMDIGSLLSMFAGA